jgi:tRNA A-37 threonylcarbamoyl transferase component Bud32
MRCYDDLAMSMRLRPGTLLAGTYRVIRLIGVGGMGEVYEASHARLAGRYAVKVLLGEIVARAEIMQRFTREAEVTSALRHPNIVQVLDFNVTPDGNPYLVMEYLDGIELAEEIRRGGAMPVERVLDLVGQLASGLAAAHGQGVVHRDLKPQNMFLVKLPGDREVIKMVDFGISKVREATTKLTMEAAILGTPQYMAPEQAQGKLDEITDRTDQFALGAITYELCAGRPAFAGGSVASILYQVVHQQPEPLAKVAPSVGPAVEAVVGRALAKAQADRYPSVLAFHAELVHAAATDRQVHTIETPSPLYLPTGGEPVAEPGPPGAPPVARTAQLPPAVAATAQLPQVAPTARLVETAPLVPTAALAPAVQAAAVTTLGGAAASLAGPAPVKARRRRLGLAALAALAVLAVVAVGYGWWAVRPVQLPPAPVAAPAPVAMPAATPKTARILVENSPPGLRVSVDGLARELPIVLPGGPDVHTLLFEAPGYHPTEFHVDGMRETRSLVLAMQPLAAAPPPAEAEPDTKAAAEGDTPAVKPAKSRRRHRRATDVITDR